MTPRERECLDAINRLTIEGVPPTYAQLADALGLRSASGVYRLLDALRSQRLVTWDYQRTRSLFVLANNPAYAAGALNALSTTALRILIASALDIIESRDGGVLVKRTG